MNKIHKKRIYRLSLFALGLGIAVSLILYALKQNINVFLTPTEVASQHLASHYRFKLGGMVKKGSVVHASDSLAVHFTLTDFSHDIKVSYNGILPDLFREGKGALVEGSINNQGEFIATQVLAKHDENYMPKQLDPTKKENIK